MSSREPPTLLQLATQSLLRNEALASSALQETPRHLIPTLLKEAFTGRHTDILKVMVAAWPFPCLQMGALMTSDMVTLQAVLDGVDMQLRRQFHPRGQKLQVFNLRNVRHEFWGEWAAKQDRDRSSETVCKKQETKHLRGHALRQHLKVVIDLCLESQLDEMQAFLLKWAQERRGSLQFCCVKMQIQGLPVNTVREILMIIQPECIQQLEVNTEWGLSSVAWFGPCLGQMRNLRKLSLTLIHEDIFKFVYTPSDTEKKRVTEFISQFSNSNCLQHLSMVGVQFLRGRMNQLLWCLKTPLESLSISLCKFSQSDLESLAQCQSLCQLKHLEFGGVIFSGLCSMSLGVLLQSVAGTLMTLQLEHCRIEDSQLGALLPALSQCSQLRRLNFIDNDISLAVLKDLLHHTANLSQLVEELYPAPLECYNVDCNILADRFVQLSTELMNTICSARQPHSVSFATKACIQCHQRCVYDQQSSLCLCWR